MDLPFSIIPGDGLPALLTGPDIGVVCGELNLEGRIRGIINLWETQAIWKKKKMQKGFLMKRIKRERKGKEKKKKFKANKPSSRLNAINNINK